MTLLYHPVTSESTSILHLYVYSCILVIAELQIIQTFNGASPGDPHTLSYLNLDIFEAFSDTNSSKV